MGDAVLLAGLALPLGLAALWAWPLTRRFAVTAAPLAAAPAILTAVWPGEITGTAFQWLFLGVHLDLDLTGRAFLFFTAVLWTAAGIFARSYVTDANRDAYFGFHLLTLTGNLCLVTAADILTFYVGFATMTFAAYGLVVHDRSEPAFRAGRIYIVMSVLGEALLLAGLILAGATGTDWTFDAVPAAYAAAGAPTLLATLFTAGFAVKAGLVPLHMWLPLAHPVAPTPASAVLSGAMIKAGLLGWLRFLPLGELALPALGSALIGLGIATAFYAVIIGVAQREAKTVLAYSSVSQMGYMALGTGIALLSPSHAAVAFLAVGHYAAHHAVAKGALFLAVGVAPGPARSRWRRRLVYLAAGVPALALAGAPFTSGAVAKSALKHAAQALPDSAAALAVVLSLAAAGTTVLLARFIAVLPVNRSAGSQARERPGLWGSWLALTALSGLAPLWLSRVQPPPAVVEPVPVLGLADSLWPLAVGILFVAAIWRFKHHLAPLRRWRPPPGDLVEPIAQGLATVDRRLEALDPRPRTARFIESSARRLGEAGRALSFAATRADRHVRAGIGFGAALFLTLILLAVAILAR